MIRKNVKILATVFLLTVLIEIIPYNLNAQKVSKLIEKEQYEKAEEYCFKQKGEKQKLCFTELAEAYLNAKIYDKASEFYEKTDKSKEGFSKIADAYLDSENYEKAYLFYKKANNNIGFEKIGDAYLKKENFEKAVEYYRKAFPDDYNKRKICYKRTADACLNSGYCDKAKNYHKKSGENISNEKMGDCFFLKKDFYNAKVYYERAFRNNKELLYKSYNKIGDGYFDSEKYDNAFECYKEAENYKGIEKLGDIYFLKKDYKKALQYYSEGYYFGKTAGFYGKDKLKEGEKNLYKKLADSYFEITEYYEAVEFYEKADLDKEKEKCMPYITFIDKRDDKVYKKTKIGNQIWMAENLAFKAENGCWAYDNDPKNTLEYGYLYNWETAKNVCPEGWHLPSIFEFYPILNRYGGYKNFNEKNYIGIVKAENGLRALFAGEYSVNEFRGFGEEGLFWSATLDDYYKDNSVVYVIEFRNQPGAGITRSNNLRGGYSVRCIKD